MIRLQCVKTREVRGNTKKGKEKKDREKNRTSKHLNMRFVYWGKCFLFLILSQRTQYETCGTMACWDLLNSPINIWSGAETDRDNGLTVLQSLQLTLESQREVWRKGEHLVFYSYGTCLQGSSIFHGGTTVCVMEEIEKGSSSCWHCYQGVWCVCVFNSKMAPTFHSPLSLPLLTSAALRFENSDTVVRATAAARPQPTQHILTLCVCVRVWERERENEAAACFNKTTLCMTVTM